MDIEDPKLGTHSLLSVDKDVQYRGGPFDPTNPRSLLNICPKEMRDGLSHLPHFWLYMSEREIEAKVQPEPELNRIRLAFWKEYEKSQSELKPMHLSDISRHLGFPSVFLIKAFKSPPQLAWILCPPASYDTFLDEALSHGMKKLRQILDLPLFNQDGEVNTKAADLVLKAVAFLDLRKHGGIMARNMNLNVDASTKELRAITSAAQIEDIDAKIAELESRQEIEQARREVGARSAPQVQYAPTERLLNDMASLQHVGDDLGQTTKELFDGTTTPKAARARRDKKAQTS